MQTQPPRGKDVDDEKRVSNATGTIPFPPDDNFANSNLIQFKFKFSLFIHPVVRLCTVILILSSTLKALSFIFANHFTKKTGK